MFSDVPHNLSKLILTRYTPGFLYMAIHELDEAHLGRFSFRSRDGVLEVCDF